MVALALEIIRMTAGAIGHECGVRPVDGLGVVLVASSAGEIATMIQGLVSQTHVPVIMWKPGRSVVAEIALLLRNEVPGAFARRNNAVVAGRA